MIPLYRTDNDIAKFFRKIRNGHLAKTAGGFNSEFHRNTRPAKKRSTDDGALGSQ